MELKVGLHVFILLHCLDLILCCSPICQWVPWKSWSSCSATCGGGIQYRTRALCCPGANPNFNDCYKNCNMNSSASENGNCNTQCYNGGSFRQGRCECQDTNYGACCQEACSTITQCSNRSCTTQDNTVCKRCHEDNLIFKKCNGDKECQRVCAWNNHSCWPGTCGTSGLAKDCQCVGGFVKRSTVDYSSANAGETTCQPNATAQILTCDVVVIGSNDEHKRASNLNVSTACESMSDMYGNFQPTTVEFSMASEFSVGNTYSIFRPLFIVEENFGISDTSIYIKIKSVEGAFVFASAHHLLIDMTSSTSVAQIHRDSGSITVKDSKYSTLRNGEALCLDFEAKAGGYLKSIDRRFPNPTPSDPVPYIKVSKLRTLCYRYDNSPPEHCSKLGSCSSEPLMVLNRITRSNVATLRFNGWEDPIPSGGQLTAASAIESFHITVHMVLPSNGTMKADYTRSVYSRKVNSSVNSLQFNVTSYFPQLYCITLEVKDIADNVRRSRRFMLYDNISFIETAIDKPFQFVSASKDTQFTWQTHYNNMCLSWKDYFVNRFYLDSKLLNPIEPDSHGQIVGVYEQTTGLLPFSGTPNNHGIINFFISWKLNDKAFNSEQLVPNFQHQNFCIGLNISDGETYTFNVRPVDIVNNTVNETRAIYIDGTPPYISNANWEIDNYEITYLHPLTDLSMLRFTFDAYDPHSGLVNVLWKFETGKTSNELYRGYVGYSGRTYSLKCHALDAACNCPNIGHCELSNFSISIDSDANDIHLGKHTGNYSLTITATNRAMVSSSKTFVVPIDISVPREGVVYINLLEPNATNVTVQWSGFNDEESGILFSRVFISDHCLGVDEVVFGFTSIPYKENKEINATFGSIEISRDFSGNKIVTVVAYNGALGASLPVCSVVIEGLKPLSNTTDDTDIWPIIYIVVGSSIGVLLFLAGISILIRRCFVIKDLETNQQRHEHTRQVYEGRPSATNSQNMDEHFYDRCRTTGILNQGCYEMDSMTTRDDICCPNESSTCPSLVNADGQYSNVNNSKKKKNDYENLKLK